MDNISTKRLLSRNEVPLPLLLHRTRLESLEALLLCYRHILELASVPLSNKRSPVSFFGRSFTQQLPPLLLSRAPRLCSEDVALCQLRLRVMKQHAANEGLEPLEGDLRGPPRCIIRGSPVSGGVSREERRNEIQQLLGVDTFA